MTSDVQGRRYAGMSTEDRVAARRDLLLDAGLHLFGTDGYHRVSVKQICDRAGLTQRYFYESFDDRETLLRVVYDTVVAQANEAVDATAGVVPTTIAELAHITLSEFINYLTTDPRRARVMLIEIVGVSPLLDARRLAVIHEFANRIATLACAYVGIDTPSREFHLAAVGLVGAVNQLLVDWVLGSATSSPTEIESVCSGMFSAVFATFVPDIASR